MCGIAGMVALKEPRVVPRASLHAMADALAHRGPDEDGFFFQPGIGLGSRRLSIVGLADGQQPVSNEDGTVHAIFNGEIFEHQQIRKSLAARGHHLTTGCDTEIIPHLWEEHGESMFERLRGQFALALWDQRQKRLILARDRFGIAPLYWTEQNGWLLFASEIKALLASRLVPVEADPRGIDQVFTFFATPGPVTCFKGISSLLPGHYLDIRTFQWRRPSRITNRRYWDMDFPKRGEEEHGRSAKQLIDGLEEVLLQAVERRLRADVPVVGYLSGGVDSSLVAALANHLRQEPLPTFTIRIQDPQLDESEAACRIARHLRLPDPVITECSRRDLLGGYSHLIRAAECPVIDTSCAALLLQARSVNEHGYKVALTGEGADEWLAGYPWFKINRILGLVDGIPGFKPGRFGRWLFLKLAGPAQFQWRNAMRAEQAVGGHNAWIDVYGLMSMMKYRLYSQEIISDLGDGLPYDGLDLNREKVRNWHPLHQTLYLGAKVLLPGLLLHAKGDRAAMHSSVETRYPFLDEDVFDYVAPLHPRWKLRGLRRDKYLLRLVAERWLPKDVAWRSKVVFRAPPETLYSKPLPKLVSQLLSPESLRKTGYFNPGVVQRWRDASEKGKLGFASGFFVKMGLTGVVSTQLWHHMFIESSLAELPSAATAPLTRKELVA
jgi:asparagine synthase (glutamine-hydrolysing)